MTLEITQKIPSTFSSQWITFSVLGYTFMYSEVYTRSKCKAPIIIPGKQSGGSALLLAGAGFSTPRVYSTIFFFPFYQLLPCQYNIKLLLRLKICITCQCSLLHLFKFSNSLYWGLDFQSDFFRKYYSSIIELLYPQSTKDTLFVICISLICCLTCNIILMRGGLLAFLIYLSPLLMPLPSFSCPFTLCTLSPFFFHLNIWMAWILLPSLPFLVLLSVL